MSGSRSSQKNETTNVNVNNVLDGGAIEASFKFAESVTDEAFDNVDKALDNVTAAVDKAGALGESALAANTEVTKAALEANSATTDEAFDAFDRLSTQAFETNETLTSKALDDLSDQNNRAISAMAGLQNQQNQQNEALLKGIQETIKSNNTDGASDVLNVQKQSTLVFAAMVVAVFFIVFRKV